MSLIQFTENYEDLSTDLGYQFKFLCDRCHNGYMSSFQTSVAGAAGSVLRVAGNLFGGLLGSASSNSYEIQRAVGSKGHDSALQHAVEEVRAKFHQCKRCGKWVCPEICWNTRRGLCNDCAPDVQAELAAAQVAETVSQIHEGVKSQNFTKGLDLGGENAAACPQCGAKVTGKFCGTCGAQTVPKVACPGCSAQVDLGIKFCPECGQKIEAAKPKCKQCGKEYETAPKFCQDCGGKM
jgi:hypothetical protein